jgi:hypothetical protein
MKQSANFPYDVEIQIIELLELPQSSESFEYEIKLPEYYTTDSKYQHIQDNIDLIAETNCSATLYRNVISTKSNSKLTITVPRNKVNINFTIDLLLVANKEFSWENQLLQKGMPIAHFGSFKKDIDTRSTGLISFEKFDGKEILISNSDHTIKIKIPEIQFEYLMQKQNSLLVKEILTSQFAQIALLEACKELNENSKRNNLFWYKELLNKWRKLSGYDEYPQDSDHLKFVNDILKNPSIKLVNHLIATDKQDQDG